MSQIWTDAYLAALDEQANDEIIAQLDCIFDRFALNIIKGQSVYTLPDSFRRIIRITWKGKKVEPITFEEMTLLHQASSILNEIDKVEAPMGGQAYFYCLHPTNSKSIRFYPTPGENISDAILGNSSGDASNNDTTIYGAAVNFNVVVSCYRNVDQSIDKYSLPSYIVRRTKKAWVLYKAYAKEGPGQDLKASKYFYDKFNYLMARVKEINSATWISVKYRLQGGFQELDGQYQRTPHKPILPANFEDVRY
jgi:hypothetical protein